MATTWINRGHFYTPHVRPILVDCNFIVDSTNGNGFGVRSLKGQGVASLFMHTTATPGRTAAGILNPNPPPGYILMQFADNFQRYYGGFTGQIGPVSGAATSVTANAAYVITGLGTATQAQWNSIGLPNGVTPALGAPFIANASTAVPAGGTVGTQAFSGIDHIEVFGDPNSEINPTPVGPSPNVGGWIMLACYFEGAITAPANNSTISLASYLNQSSVVVKGE
jgi:hypothetical protein